MCGVRDVHAGVCVRMCVTVCVYVDLDLAWRVVYMSYVCRCVRLDPYTHARTYLARSYTHTHTHTVYVTFTWCCVCACRPYRSYHCTKLQPSLRTASFLKLNVHWP